MKLVLTQKGDGKKLVVDVDAIRLLEPVDDGTHIVFGADMGRIVVEPVDQIIRAIGAIVPA